MKVVLFDIIQLQQTGSGQVRVAEPLRDVPINPDLVSFLLPGQVPGELEGPSGPIPREVTQIYMAGGMVMVDQRRDQVLWRLVNDQLDLAGAESPADSPEPRRLRIHRGE